MTWTSSEDSDIHEFQILTASAATGPFTNLASVKGL
ncbi:hypothetical protein GMMP15_80035 [Candidatus Magnetomoraceae bacterium gMMP-15]